MTIYYIGKAAAHGASDANPGTIDQPFESFNAVRNILQPGDTVYFREGTYNNPSYGDGDIWKSPGDSIVKLNDVHGSQALPITIAAEPGANVKLQYDAGGAIVVRNSSFINIEGFDIEGPGTIVTKEDAASAQWSYRIPDASQPDGYAYFERDAEFTRDANGTVIDSTGLSDISNLGVQKPDMFNSNAIALPLGSHNITIENNNIHDSSGTAISGNGGNDYISILNNNIYNNTWYTSSGTHAISFKFLESIE